MEITASNISKQRPLMVPTGPIEFPQNTKLIRTVLIEVHVVHIHNFIKLIDLLAWILPRGTSHATYVKCTGYSWKFQNNFRDCDRKEVF